MQRYRFLIHQTQFDTKKGRSQSDLYFCNTQPPMSFQRGQVEMRESMGGDSKSKTLFDGP